MGSNGSAAPGASAEGKRPRAQFDLGTEPAPAATDCEQRLLAIWEDVLDIEGLGVEDDFFELGGDSLTGLTLFGEIEQQFGEALPLSTLIDCPTVRLLAKQLDRPAPQVQHPLVAIRGEGRRPPLFFAHTILGDVLFVREFLAYFPADQPLYAIEARGLDGEDEPHTSFAEMAADFVQLIRRVQPRGPYFLAGLCDGSLTAVEIGRILRAAGEEVAFIGLIDPRTSPVEAPWLYWHRPDAPLTRLLRWTIRRGRHARRRLGPLIGWHPIEETVERPVAGAKMKRRHAAIRAGMTSALEAYRPEPYGGSITIFASAHRVRQLSGRKPGWSSLAARCETHVVAEGHVQAFDTDLPRLGASLAEALAKAQAASAEGLSTQPSSIRPQAA